MGLTRQKVSLNDGTQAVNCSACKCKAELVEDNGLWAAYCANHGDECGFSLWLARNESNLKESLLMGQKDKKEAVDNWNLLAFYFSQKIRKGMIK